MHTTTATATDAAGNTSVRGASLTVTVDTTGPAPTDVTLTNGSGTAQTLDTGDKATITYSEQLMASSFCSVWTSNSTTQTLSDATVTLAEANRSDSLTVSTPSCTQFTDDLATGF
jgi:hypothetical protein